MHMSFTLMGALALTVLETFGTACVRRWASLGTDYGMLILGAMIFSCIGVLLGIFARTLGHMSIINAVWQSTSIASVTLYCVFIHGESLTRIQTFGVVLAVLSSLCLVGETPTWENGEGFHPLVSPDDMS